MGEMKTNVQDFIKPNKVNLIKHIKLRNEGLIARIVGHADITSAPVS
jgi:hypothetical protein